MSTSIREPAEYVPSGGEHLRESARAFRTVFQTMASAIFIYRGKSLRYVNCAAEVITGYTREELVSMDFCDLVHPNSRDLITNSTASRYEIKILTKGREERWLDNHQDEQAWSRMDDEGYSSERAGTLPDATEYSGYEWFPIS